MKLGRDPLTLAALQARFSDEGKCLAFLERVRWPAGPACPHCGAIDRASRVKSRPGQFVCLECAKSFSVTSGTPMHKTHLPICAWIVACHLIASSSKGISSLKLASLLGLQYRTTWHLAHRIRAMMDSDPGLLTGIVELDETYPRNALRRSALRDGALRAGSKPRAANQLEPPAPVPLLEPKRKKRKAGRGTDKPMAFTAAQRGGQLRLTPVLSHSAAALAAPVLRWVGRAAVIATDELPAYLAIGRRQAGHIRVNPPKRAAFAAAAGEYARTDARTGLRAHVNTAESVHAMFKRALVGPRNALRRFALAGRSASRFHSVSGKHVGRYLRETEFRWNNRGPFEGRLNALFGSNAGPMPLKGLFA